MSDADRLDVELALGMRLGLEGLAEVEEDAEGLVLAFGAMKGLVEALLAFFLGIGAGESEMDRMDGEDAADAS